jgi:hypothetical protein
MLVFALLEVKTITCLAVASLARPLCGGTTQNVHLNGHRWEEQKKSLNIETFRGKYFGLHQVTGVRTFADLT